ncbi:MAG: cation:proton antiporter, partial [Leptolyngbya sp. Prado105]|jgi:multicomponent Na+:H+ antiporter subunit D|nr:cation:proton antiporter [Leptolyngbya sp. Prado105]
LNLKLLDSFGVTLTVDSLTGYFILTNAIVTLAVLFYCWQTSKSTFFYAQTLILHASLNAAFVCSDFVSLYIALEVSGIAAFLMIAYPRTDRSIWVGLRYLFTSNIAMLFYLIGAALVYQAEHSFSFTGLRNSPPEAVALIFLGLLVKAGVFISGLWLPTTHSESETPVSALLSGVVVKASMLAMIRCALILDEIDPIVRIFGVATTLLGVFYAVFERDTKRMLAFSTVSQLGFIIAAPEAAGFYTLSHGLVKSALFLLVGNFPSRDFKELQTKTIQTPIWIALVIASLSISGSPLWAGFGAKVFTSKNLLPWQAIAMNICAVGTATAFAKFIFLPHGNTGEKIRSGFIAAIVLLLGGLLFANVGYLQAYTVENIVKALATIGGGWLAYWVIFRRATVKLPRMLEQFDHIVGMMGLTLVLLFWMAVA